jgi:hypothetical protein
MQMTRRFCALLVALVLSPIASAAEEGKPIQLFNGTDLSGWKYVTSDPKVKMEDVWTVKDGVIHCAGHPAGYIRTEKDFTNYILKLQWRTLKKGNSGCLIRVQEPDKVWPKSIECQLNAGDAGDIWVIDEFPIKFDPRTKREGRHIIKFEKSSEKPAGEWNQYEITADGTNLTLKVNDVLQNQATEVEVVPGKILLQSEGQIIEFRNIELTELPAHKDAKPDASASGASPQRRHLEGLEGWHVTGNGNWTLKDGVIDGSQREAEKGYTHVVSDKSYKDFKASLQFKCLEGNSGFYFRVKPEGPDENKMLGIQAEIDAANNVGGLYESYGRNWLSLPAPEVVAKYFKPQEWNEMTVEGRGPHVVVHINGEKAGEINDPTIRMEGPFALQIHGGQDVHVMFKDIKIESLSE